MTDIPKFRCPLRAGALALGMAIAAATVPSVSDAQTRGGTLTYARYVDANFLDPVFCDGNSDIWILSNLFDTLILPSENGSGFQPGLASDWSISDDGMTVSLTMRDGTKFSDGSAITAEDAKWSLDRARSPENGIYNSILSSIDTLTIPAEGKLEISLKHPDPAILAALTAFNAAVLPSKLYEAAPGETVIEKARVMGANPVGSGPFMFDSWSRGASMKLVRNPHYWREGTDGKPLPYLDTLEFEIIPDDATRILKVQSGEIDGAEFIPFSRVNELKADPELNMTIFPGTKVVFANMNVRPEFKDGSPNPLSDVKVRQALNYATDKDAVIGIVTHGIGTPMSSYMSSATPMHSGEGSVFPFDIDKAKALMTESGWPDGFETTILVLPGSVDEIGIATALQQFWAPLGVKLSIEQVDNATRQALWHAGDYPIRAMQWTDDISDGSQITGFKVYSPNIEAQRSGWHNASIDLLYEESQKETDPEKRIALYAEIQAEYNQTGPEIQLFEAGYPVLLQNDVVGFVQLPLGNNIFAKAYKE